MSDGDKGVSFAGGKDEKKADGKVVSGAGMDAPGPGLRPKGGAPIRSFELVRAKFDKVLGIDPLKQTFFADVFFEFKIRGGALDPDLAREGSGPPTTTFPSDTLRPSARWYLNQFDFSNTVHFTLHHDTTAQIRGDDIHLRFRANGEFAEQLEMEEFPFDTQELTVKLIIHCIIGGAVGVEIVAPGYTDEYSDEKGVRSIVRDQKYKQRAASLIKRDPELISRDRFKVDTFHLHNVWDMSHDVIGRIECHADEFPQLSMRCLVRRKPEFYLWNVVVTMLLLELLSFSAYALDPLDIEGISGRISLELTLVLTVGFYRSANSMYTPPVATLTLLDEYMLQTALTIGLTVGFHVVISFETYNWLQPWFIGAQALIILIQHIYSFWRMTKSVNQTSTLFEGMENADLGVQKIMSSGSTRYLGKPAFKRAATRRIFDAVKGEYVELQEEPASQPSSPVKAATGAPAEASGLAA